MSIRTNEELDPNEGPSFAEFAVLASLFAIILLLIPVGVFTFSWPVWLLGLLLFIDLGLLFLVSMTAVFLLRVFFADRRRGRGRSIGVAREPMVISSAEAEAPEAGMHVPGARAASGSPEGETGDAPASGRGAPD